MSDRHDILLVDDDPAVIGALGRILHGHGRLRFATSGAEALALALQSPPDLVLLDIELPGMSGFEVCSAMKAAPPLADVPIVFLTGHAGGDQEVTALALGAVDFIPKPPRPAQVLARVRMHLLAKQRADALERAAYLDALTGVANRRQFDETSQREWLRAQRCATPIALLMIDLDFFKRYNDARGHPAGDRCLEAVAQAIRRPLQRPGDLAARYGGEEFAVLLPETDAGGAGHLALRLLRAVDALGLPHGDSPAAPHVTLSIGVGTHDPEPAREAPPLASLIAAADQALYAAKAAGRHQARLLRLADVGMPGRSNALLDAPFACAAVAAGSGAGW